MIVDARVSVDKDKSPIESTVAALRRVGISQAVIFAHPESDDLAAQNEYVLEAARVHNLFPFYYIGGNPFSDTRSDLLDLPSNLSEYAGIRWHRWFGEGIDRAGTKNDDELDWALSVMDTPEFEAIVSGAAYYDMPVVFEESFSVTVEFALRYPSLDVIVPHLGLKSGGQTAALQALWDRPNVYFETSLSRLDETTLSRVGTERILFGSGYPESDPEAELDKIDRLPIPEDAKEGMYGENVLSLLTRYLAA